MLIQFVFLIQFTAYSQTNYPLKTLIKKQVSEADSDKKRRTICHRCTSWFCKWFWCKWKTL